MLLVESTVDIVHISDDSNDTDKVTVKTVRVNSLYIDGLDNVGCE